MINNEFIRLFNAIGKLICTNTFDQIEFTKSMRFHLAHVARKLHPNKSISQLSQITGLSRQQLNDSLDSVQPKKTTNKLAKLLTRLWYMRDKAGLVKKKGENSFYSTAISVLSSSYSPETAEIGLIKAGAMEEYNNDQFLIKSIALNVSENESYANELSSIAIDRLVDTFIENKKQRNSKYQNTIWHDDIHPMIAAELHQQIFKYLKHDVFVKLQDMFDDAVKSSNKINTAAKTYPVYGISVFEFLEK